MTFTLFAFTFRISHCPDSCRIAFRRRVLVIANPSRLPPATGHFSFETPLAIGRGELTRSELETSRVWSLLGADGIA